MASVDSPPAATPAVSAVVASEEKDVAPQKQEDVEAPAESLFNVAVTLPGKKEPMAVTVTSQDQIHEVRQSIIDIPEAFEFTCFHLERNGERINDFITVGEVPDLGTKSELTVVEDPYTEKEARIHLIRIRELIGAAGDRVDASHGIISGVSLFENISEEAQQTHEDAVGIAFKDYDFQAKPALASFIPKEIDPAPKTVKAITVSPWNPPPPHLKQRGHLLYLIVTTNEGEQYQITAHVSGFFVNKSSNAKFDPFPRPAPKGQSSHSLLNLLALISPSFTESFAKLQEYNNSRDPLSTYQITNAIPAAPWAAPAPTSSHCLHVPDPTRSQETYLLGGVDNTDTLRDWNEEFQSAKELPRETVLDRVFRERLVAKLFADYNDAATKGAVMVARGEIAPLNPTENKDAQIFVYNNIFFSFGADGVGTFTSEGGDEAARVATGKDVAGVKLVNQLDVEGIFTPATVVVDYLGKRIVGQSIVPGIFRQRDPGENQIDYGAVDGKDVVAADARFQETFAQLSDALKVEKHPVWDKENKRFDLEASVETKGLMGTDGRKYILDLYRITPLDIAWLEDEQEYPHRMSVLRPELVDNLFRQKYGEWSKKRAEQAAAAQKAIEEAAPGSEEKKAADKATAKPEQKKAAAKKPEGDESSDDSDEDSDESSDESSDEESDEEVSSKVKALTISGQDTVKVEEDTKVEETEDEPKFHWALNPDAFSGQVAQTDEEKETLVAQEAEVRAAGGYLQDVVIPKFLADLANADASFPMDSQSLSRTLHKRGINVRYIGKLAELTAKGEDATKLSCLRGLCIQDMVVRSFKHLASAYIRQVPIPAVPACVSHLLNCFLGEGLNATPVAETESSLRDLYTDADWSFEEVTPASLRASIKEQTLKRFRYKLDEESISQLRPWQLLREACLSLGVQLLAGDYFFTAAEAEAAAAPPAKPTVPATNGQANSDSKKKKKKGRESPTPAMAAPVTKVHTFSPDDIVDLVPSIKDSAPRSALAEEALEAGRLSLTQGHVKLGQELLLESLSLHEQIYGILHPEVARVYNSLSMIYFGLEEKDMAVELSRKAIIVAERTVGVDASETLLNYLNLSLFVHQQGDSKAALVYTKHALKLWKTIYGPGHPDSITTINNAAVMLQNLKAYHESRLWFEESLRLCEGVFGKMSVNTATLLFQLAQALALDQDSKGAVNRMREAYNVFLAELGAEDRNTKEAEVWLEQLTLNAVNIAKQAKDVEARRLRAGIRFNTRVPGSAAAPPPGRIAQGSQMDSRSIDELIRFIEGEPGGKTSSKKRPSRGNPKRRGQAVR